MKQFLYAFIIFLFCLVQVGYGEQLTLITIGDSLTQGVGDDQYENGRAVGYPGRLKNLLSSQYDVLIHNLGIAGYDTSGLMSPYDPEEAPQLDQAMSLITQATNENRQPMVLLWTGSNDLWSLYEWKCTVDSPPSCAEEDLQEFTSNLDTILNRLASTDSKLLIANLDDHSKRPVVADSAYIELRSDITPDELPLLSEQTSHYNTAIRELAKTYEATVVDIFKTTIFQQSETISNYDGDHPNSLGYDQLADIWYQAVLSAFSTVQDPNLVNSNALFDWAEITFPGVFKNPGSKTYRLGDFWVRYYESTNVFLGTTKDDVYVYGDIFGGFMNVGKISNFIVLQ